MIASLPFDAPEPKNPNGDISAYGSNDYLTSNIRQWLNIETGEDFKPKTPFDTPFTNWDYIKPMNLNFYWSFCVETLRNSDGDRFWLLSEEEFEKFKFFEKEENKRKKDINGVPKTWWLRTPHNSNNVYVRRIMCSGAHSSDVVYKDNGVVPVCQIKL